MEFYILHLFVFHEKRQRHLLLLVYTCTSFFCTLRFHLEISDYMIMQHEASNLLMETTIGVSGDKGSSRQQIHSLREKYLTLSGARGVSQLRCVADVPQEGWLGAGTWISRKTGNTEPHCLFRLAVTVGASWVCLSVSALQRGAQHQDLFARHTSSPL